MRALSVRPEEGPTIFKEILEDLPLFWVSATCGTSTNRFGCASSPPTRSSCSNDVLLGYLLGAVTTHGLA